MDKWDCVWTGIHGLGALTKDEPGQDEEQGMADLEGCEGKLFLTLYKLKRLKKENPRFREDLAVFEKEER